MDFRNAAGRNWTRTRPRRRTAKPGQGAAPLRLPETVPPAGQLEHRDAAGRNWAHERPHRRRVTLAPRPDAPYPAREAGGGDHDRPYEFRAPSADRPFPFTSRAFGRLLVLRGRIQDGDLADDRRPAEPVGVRSIAGAEPA